MKSHLTSYVSIAAGLASLGLLACSGGTEKAPGAASGMTAADIYVAPGSSSCADAGSKGSTGSGSGGTTTPPQDAGADCGCTPSGSGGGSGTGSGGSGSGGTGDGSKENPFTDLGLALEAAASIAGDVTVHVAGGAHDVLVNGVVVLRPGLHLVGDGLLHIIGGGTTSSGDNAAVVVAAGASLEGVTVTNDKGGYGIVTGPGGLAVLTDVVVTGSGGGGIHVEGAASLTGVTASNNGGDGLLDDGVGKLTIGAEAGLLSHFDHNGKYGLEIAAGVELALGATTASGNGDDGLHIAAAAAVALVDGLEAEKNGGHGIIAAGIDVEAAANLRLRNCRLLGNSGSGLVFAAGAGATLDLGGKSDPGGNVLSAEGDDNGRSAICLANLAAGVKVIAGATGNSLDVCAAAAVALQATCKGDWGGAGYADVVSCGPTVSGLTGGLGVGVGVNVSVCASVR